MENEELSWNLGTDNNAPMHFYLYSICHENHTHVLKLKFNFVSQCQQKTILR